MSLILKAKKKGLIFSPAVFYKASAAASLALDANVFTFAPGSTTISVTISTVAANEIIIAMVSGDSSATGVSGSTLGAFTLRASGNRFSSQFSNTFYKVASGTLSSEVITVTFPTATAFLGSLNVISVKGANTGVVFDPNVALPGIVGTGGGGGSFATATTTNAHTFIFGTTQFDTTANPTAGSGWTLLHSGNGILTEYQIVTSQQPALAMTSGTGPSGDVDVAIADAITA